MRAILCLLAVLLALAGCADDVSTYMTNYSPDSGQTKIAYAAYDAVYSDEDIYWLADHAGLLILHESLSLKTSLLRQRNPNLVLLLYKFSGLTNESSIGHSASGFNSIEIQHPDWFLLDKFGKRATDDYDDFSRGHSFYMDPANPGWMHYSCNDYLASLDGFDGVFLDVLHFEINQVADNGLAGYSSDSQLRDSVLAYLDYCHRRFVDAGKLFIVNGAELIYQDPYIVNKPFWQLVLDRTDGALEESFVNRYWWRKEGTHSEERWLQQIEAMEYAAANDKYYIAFAQNPGTREDSLYNLASFFLASGENSYFYDMAQPKYRIANFRKAYDSYGSLYMIDLGRPLAVKYSQNGLWLRDFEKGIVVVNPGSRERSFVFDSAMRDAEGNLLQSPVQIHPNSGLIAFN